MLRSAAIGIIFAGAQFMAVHMIAVYVVNMPVMDIVAVVSVLNSGVTTVIAVLMGVRFVLIAFHKFLERWVFRTHGGAIPGCCLCGKVHYSRYRYGDGEGTHERGKLKITAAARRENVPVLLLPLPLQALFAGGRG
jgi:hypothetical protein